VIELVLLLVLVVVWKLYPTEAKKVLFFGKNVQLNDYVHITAMEIGNNVYWLVKYISQIVHGSMQDA
jgi:lipopolysaccharide O-acetyltransferase